MDTPMLVNQQKLTFISLVPTLDAVYQLNITAAVFLQEWLN